MPEELKGFTPVAPDRDAILFAAGQATARRWAGWKWLTFGLVLSNAVTLGVMFWPKTAAPVPPPVVVPDPLPADVLPSFPLEPYSYIALRQGWERPPVGAGETPSLPVEPLTPRAIHGQSW